VTVRDGGLLSTQRNNSMQWFLSINYNEKERGGGIKKGGFAMFA